MNRIISPASFYKNPLFFYRHDSSGTGSQNITFEKEEIIPDDHDERKVFCVNCKKLITSVTNKIEIEYRHQHTFFNPQGFVFSIRCYKVAPGCSISGYKTDEFTWFPGFSWQVALCRGCNIHLGWRYESGNSSFYGLIHNKLLEE